MSNDQKEKATATEDKKKNEAPAKAETEDKKKIETPARAKAEKSGVEIKPVTFWMAKEFLATWQSALLLRATGWAEDKMVSEAEFKKAMIGAMTRRQGGYLG